MRRRPLFGTFEEMLGMNPDVLLHELVGGVRHCVLTCVEVDWRTWTTALGVNTDRPPGVAASLLPFRRRCDNAPSSARMNHSHRRSRGEPSNMTRLSAIDTAGNVFKARS